MITKYYGKGGQNLRFFDYVICGSPLRGVGALVLRISQKNTNSLFFCGYHLFLLRILLRILRTTADAH